MLRIKSSAGHSRCCTDFHAPFNNFERVYCWCLAGVLNLFASRLKIVGDNRGKMGISLVTQDAAHKGFCWTFPLYRPSRSLERFRTQGFLRIESTAVLRYARAHLCRLRLFLFFCFSFAVFSTPPRGTENLHKHLSVFCILLGPTTYYIAKTTSPSHPQE